MYLLHVIVLLLYINLKLRNCNINELKQNLNSLIEINKTNII